MFLKELYRKLGIELEVHNLITDYTLADGKTRAHIAHQVVANGIPCTDGLLVEHVRIELPKGSRIACIAEVFGDYELKELEEMACTGKVLREKSRWLYHDMALIKEYMAEFINEN